MRQLIARIDDDLHLRLKARARAEGRSLNALVTELLRSGVARSEVEARVLARMETSGLRVVPPLERRAPTRDAAIRSTQGVGRVASEALLADRRSR